MQQLFIPDKINVGYQNRNDTYTKKLAYVIYYDQKGVLRKEKSWNSWRDQKINNTEFQNDPTEGFVLNKGVGGNRHSYGWNTRNEYIRVYDPRDFEFEISIANLLFILRECDCSKGKGLEGKFVYAWHGTELILLPEISQDFENSKNYTKLQGQSVKAKELVPGYSYKTKTQEVLLYLGKFDFHYNHQNKTEPVKQFVFWNTKPSESSDNFVYLSNVKTIATLESDVIPDNFSKLVDKFCKSRHGSKIIKLYLKSEKATEDSYGWRHEWYFQVDNDTFIQCCSHFSNYNTSQIHYITQNLLIFIKDGKVNTQKLRNVCYNPNRGQSSRFSDYWIRDSKKISWIEPVENSLWMVLESGKEFKY